MASEIKVDTISEKTSANGVTIDGVSLKDSKIATANSVDSDAYVDGSIDAAHIASDAVTTAKILNDNVTAAKMADNSIDSDAYVDASIDNAHLADNAVDTAEIADNAVTLAKMDGLARGTLIYGDASGDPAALAVGGADEVLTHDGTDLAWAAAGGGGKVLQVQQTSAFSRTTGSGTTYTDCGISDTITCSETSSKVLFIASFHCKIDNNNAAVSGVAVRMQVLRSDDAFVSDSNRVFEGSQFANFPENSGMDFALAQVPCMVAVDSPSSTSELTYKVQIKAAWYESDLWEVSADVESGVYGKKGITLIEIGA